MAANIERVKLYTRDLLRVYLHATDAKVRQVQKLLEKRIRRLTRSRACLGLNDAAYHLYVQYSLPKSAREKNHE